MKRVRGEEVDVSLGHRIATGNDNYAGDLRVRAIHATKIHFSRKHDYLLIFVTQAPVLITRPSLLNPYYSPFTLHTAPF